MTSLIEQQNAKTIPHEKADASAAHRLSEISCVHHPDFDRPEVVHDILETLPESGNSDCDEQTRISGQDYCLPNRPLLTADAERSLFLRMNLLRYLAARRQRRPDSDTGRAACRRVVRNLLADAESVRNEILEANQRLVVSNAMLFVRSGVPLADLISEGNLALMKAVDCFDISRGFRLSTYATFAIRRHLSRYTQREQKRAPHLSEDPIEPRIADKPAEWIDDHPGHLARDILKSLAPREREIVKMRFGLNRNGKPHTLDAIGRRFGISKERVRQLLARSCNDAFRQYACRVGMDE